MIEVSWFRDQVDAELGATPEAGDDRLAAVVAQVDPPARRRVAEWAAAGSVVLLTVGLVVLTLVLGHGRAVLGGKYPDTGSVASTEDAPTADLPPVTAPAGLPGAPPGTPATTGRLGATQPGGAMVPGGVAPGGGVARGPGGGPGTGTGTAAGGGTPVTTGPGGTPARTTTPPPATTTPPTTTAPPPTTTEPPPTTTEPPPPPPPVTT
jgi:hypothetical protein